MRLTPGSSELRRKEELKALSQDQLIEKMLKLQSKLGHKGAGKEIGETEQEGKMRRPSDSQKTQQVAWDLTEDWVRKQARR